MNRLNAFIISFCVVLASLTLLIITKLYGDINKDLLINLSASILTVGFTVFLIDVSRERSRTKMIKQMLPTICDEIQTAGNSILSLLAVRFHKNDGKLIKQIMDIRDRAAWSEATVLLLDRAMKSEGVGKKYLKNFDMEYLEMVYKTAKSEEKNLNSIYARYPQVFENIEFTKEFAKLTKSVRQIIWAYDETKLISQQFLLAYGKDRGLNTKNPDDVIMYHMSIPIKLFIQSYYDFIVAFGQELGISRSWIKQQKS